MKNTIFLSSCHLFRIFVGFCAITLPYCLLAISAKKRKSSTPGVHVGSLLFRLEPDGGGAVLGRSGEELELEWSPVRLDIASLPKYYLMLSKVLLVHQIINFIDTDR